MSKASVATKYPHKATRWLASSQFHSFAGDQVRAAPNEANLQDYSYSLRLPYFPA